MAKETNNQDERWKELFEFYKGVAYVAGFHPCMFTHNANVLKEHIAEGSDNPFVSKVKSILDQYGIKVKCSIREEDVERIIFSLDASPSNIALFDKVFSYIKEHMNIILEERISNYSDKTFELEYLSWEIETPLENFSLSYDKGNDKDAKLEFHIYACETLNEVRFIIDSLSFEKNGYSEEIAYLLNQKWYKE